MTVSDRGDFKPEFNLFKRLDCHDDGIVNYLFECKINKKDIDGQYKEKIKNHFCELDLLLDESYKNSNIRNEPSKTIKIRAIELYKKLYFEDVRE
ncbi:hypothetical protein ACO3UB_06540 [Methanocaldococcus sp. 16A]